VVSNGFLLAWIEVLWHHIDISTLLHKLKSSVTTTTALSVVFVIGACLFNVLFIGDIFQQASTSAAADGPALLASAAADDEPLLTDVRIATNDEDTVAFIAVDESAIFNATSPLSNIIPSRDGLLIYKIKKGDTLSTVAANFGISLNTILWANDGLQSSRLRPGQEIAILPVSGVVHQVTEGETLESIAELYAVDTRQIIKFNKNYANAGTLIIPGAKPKKTAAVILLSALPSYPGYYVIPTTGWNWGRLHPHNSVDIANSCGTPIYAAAEGLVIDEKSYGFNGGYGHYLDIEHPNKTITRYAHTEENKVSVGDYVLQGDLISLIGNTGTVHGVTGCHLHFEVRGAKNPFAK